MLRREDQQRIRRKEQDLRTTDGGEKIEGGIPDIRRRTDPQHDERTAFQEQPDEHERAQAQRQQEGTTEVAKETLGLSLAVAAQEPRPEICGEACDGTRRQRDEAHGDGVRCHRPSTERPRDDEDIRPEQDGRRDLKDKEIETGGSKAPGLHPVSMQGSRGRRCLVSKNQPQDRVGSKGDEPKNKEETHQPPAGQEIQTPHQRSQNCLDYCRELLQMDPAAGDQARREDTQRQVHEKRPGRDRHEERDLPADGSAGLDHHLTWDRGNDENADSETDDDNLDVAPEP